MSTFGALKDILLGHLTRQGVSMHTEGGIDMVGAAVNSALVYIQRKRDFEWNKKTIKVSCNPRGSILTQAVDLDTDTPITIKRIIQAYGLIKPEDSGTPTVDYLSKTSRNTDLRMGKSCANIPAVIHSADSVVLSPTPNDQYFLYFEAVKWLPPLVADSDTNFIMTYGYDYMLYSSLQELNFYIKEDQRFEINTMLLRKAEEGLMQWDMSLLSPTETEIDF